MESLSARLTDPRVDLRFLRRGQTIEDENFYRLHPLLLLLFPRYYSALLRNRDSENDFAGRAPSTNVLSFNLLGEGAGGGAAVGSNDGRMKEQAALEGGGG